MMPRLPAEYRAVTAPLGAAVAHSAHGSAIEEILRTETLYAWAARQPDVTLYRGRGPVYGTTLPYTSQRVVVRHAYRGGLISRLVRDVYLPPTAAWRELYVSYVLARAGVPTPPVLAFATYRVARLFRRYDIMTAEVQGSDLATALSMAKTPDERAALLPPVAAVLGALNRVGAWHQDLNAKNIMVSRDDPANGFVLDVDRVKFVVPGAPQVRTANLARLTQSLEKLQRNAGLAPFTPSELGQLNHMLDEAEASQAAERAEVLEKYFA